MRIASLSALFLIASTVACVGATSDDFADESTENLESAESAGYRVQLKTPAGGVVAGSNAPLAIRVVGADNQVVTEFDDLHTQAMHFVAVSSDLQDFFHIHPTLGANGVLTVEAPVGRAQPYQMFFEYDPKGDAGTQTSRAALRPVGAQAVAPNLASVATAFDGSVARSVLVGDTRVELAPDAHGMIMTGMPVTLRAAVKTKTGAPATDLVEWLGMPGHAIILSEDTSTFIHAHGMRPGSGGHAGMPGMGGHEGMAMPAPTAPAPVAAGGHGGHGGHGGAPTTGTGGAESPTNLLDIDVTFPVAGYYKIFVQTKRGETVVTAPFVVRVVSM